MNFPQNSRNCPFRYSAIFLAISSSLIAVLFFFFPAPIGDTSDQTEHPRPTEEVEEASLGFCLAAAAAAAASSLVVQKEWGDEATPSRTGNGLNANKSSSNSHNGFISTFLQRPPSGGPSLPVFCGSEEHDSPGGGDQPSLDGGGGGGSVSDDGAARAQSLRGGRGGQEAEEGVVRGEQEVEGALGGGDQAQEHP